LKTARRPSAPFPQSNSALIGRTAAFAESGGGANPRPCFLRPSALILRTGGLFPSLTADSSKFFSASRQFAEPSALFPSVDFGPTGDRAASIPVRQTKNLRGSTAGFSPPFPQSDSGLIGPIAPFAESRVGRNLPSGFMRPSALLPRTGPPFPAVAADSAEFFSASDSLDRP
jgi:hypothetical protein